MNSSPSESSATRPNRSWLKDRATVAKLIAASLLLLLLAIVALPSYVSGNWPWAEPVSVQVIQQLRSLRETGLPISDWQVLSQATLLNDRSLPLRATNSALDVQLRPQNPAQAVVDIGSTAIVQIGGKRWSLQELVHPDEGQPPIGVYLLPQAGAKQVPEVEWVDVRGTEGWQQEGVRTLKFTATAGDRTAEVSARFFRAAAERTYAVVQWYAWPTGGHHNPIAWFWQDQFAQLRRQRQPWVAVYLKIPMRAQNELDSLQPLAESLAQDVQAALMADVFTPQSS